MNIAALKLLQNELGEMAHPVKLVAVTKYFDASQTQELIDAGVEVIGENRVDVAELKFPIFSELSKNILLAIFNPKKLGK